jgi:hypothetical protein
MTGLPLRLLWRWCRYEVFISYPSGANDWCGMFLTRRGATEAVREVSPAGRRGGEVVLLGLPKSKDAVYAEKPVLATRKL